MAESRESGARVTDVAAWHGVYPGPLFSWRCQVREGSLAPPSPATFVPVRLVAADALAEPARGNGPGIKSPDAGVVEITLANGCRLRVDQQGDARALRRIRARGCWGLAHAEPTTRPLSRTGLLGQPPKPEQPEAGEQS